MEDVAARRVATFSIDNKSVGCPTGTENRIDNKAENPALSNAEKWSGLAKSLKPEHKAMARALGYALTLTEADSWAAFSAIAAARLTPIEGACLAFAALDALPYDIAEETAAARLGAAGAPLPPFLGGMADARHWADIATSSERKAYALAAFEAMPPADQAAFFRHIQEMEIAA